MNWRSAILPWKKGKMMKKNKKLPLWSRLRNDHTQPYYPQLQSPHSLDSRRILTIHLLQNHLNNPPRSQSLSHSPSSLLLVLLLLFLLLLLRRRRRWASRISPAARAGRGGRERACRGIRTQGLLMSCRDHDHWTVSLLGWSSLFRGPSTTNGRASPFLFFF